LRSSKRFVKDDEVSKDIGKMQILLMCDRFRRLSDLNDLQDFDKPFITDLMSRNSKTICQTSKRFKCLKWPSFFQSIMIIL
jgi:hypothetical protein